MLAPLTIARWHGRHLLSRRLGLVLISVAALAISGSVVALVVRLLGSGESPRKPRFGTRRCCG
ncbi:MAG: hypothetical protein ACR2OO_03860 [Thermomicrobiales bacterium]